MVMELKAEWSSAGFTLDAFCVISSTEEKPWDESRQHCQDPHPDLIIIISQEKQDLQKVRVVPGSNYYVWIGLNTRHTEGSYKLVDGKTDLANVLVSA